MANENRIAGTIQVSIDGVVQNAKGNWTYNLGKPKREGMVGADKMHGYKETPQVPFIEGEITDRRGLDLAALVAIDGATVMLTLANGKAIMLRDAWYAGEGTVGTDEANIAARFEGMSADEVKANG